MNVHIILVDSDGKETTRVEQRRWLLNFVSGCLENNREIVVTTDGGTISARPIQTGLIAQPPHTVLERLKQDNLGILTKACQRAEQVIRNLALCGALTGDYKEIALNESSNLIRDMNQIQ